MHDPDDPPVALLCTACGKGGHLHTWERFPTLRWCHPCIRLLQWKLYQTCGFIPPIPFLVLDLTWKIAPNNHRLIPPGPEGMLQVSRQSSTLSATLGTLTRS